MRKIIIATAALAFLSTSAFAQDKGAAPAAGGDSMSKSDMSKMKKSSKKSKKSSAKSGDDSMSKQ
jgi:hypothetical protein